MSTSTRASSPTGGAKLASLGKETAPIPHRWSVAAVGRIAALIFVSATVVAPPAPAPIPDRRGRKPPTTTPGLERCNTRPASDADRVFCLTDGLRERQREPGRPPRQPAIGRTASTQAMGA